MEETSNISPDMAGPTDGALPVDYYTAKDGVDEEPREINPFSLYEKDIFEKDFRLKPDVTVVHPGTVPVLADYVDEPLSPEEEEEIGTDPKDSSAPESAESSPSSESSETASTNASDAVPASPASAEKDSGKPKASGKSSTPTS